VLSEIICGPHVKKFGDPCTTLMHLNRSYFIFVAYLTMLFQ